MAQPPNEKLKVFYSYAHADQLYRDQLERHLSNLKRLYGLQTWFDRHIKPGDNWENVLEKHLNNADLIFLLISPDFLYSDYCYNKEMTHALERHARGEARVIPIIVRQVHWANAPFSHLQILPTDAKPVGSWTNPDEAYYDVVLGIEQAIQTLLISRKTQKTSLNNKGNLRADHSQYREATTATSNAHEPNRARASLGVPASLRASASQYREATTATSNAHEPNDALTYYNKGIALHNLNRYEEAITAFDQAIHLNPTYANAYYNKGIALHNLNRYEEAITAFDQATHLDPAYDRAYHNKGIALHNLNRYEEAISTYDQTIHLNPTYTNAYYNKGIALHNLNRYEEAISTYDQTIQLDPTDAYAYYNKGIALHNLNRYEEAISTYDQAIQLDPTDAYAYYNKGIALQKLKRYKEASIAFQKADELQQK